MIEQFWNNRGDKLGKLRYIVVLGSLALSLVACSEVNKLDQGAIPQLTPQKIEENLETVMPSQEASSLYQVENNSPQIVPREGYPLVEAVTIEAGVKEGR